eukprot:s506_g27.t1
MNSCQHSKTHSRTEPEAGADTLGVDEKAASWKELEEVADWAYQSVLAVHLCRLGLAPESHALVVDCGCGPVRRDAWSLHLRARAWLCTYPGQKWACLVADLLSMLVLVEVELWADDEADEEGFLLLLGISDGMLLGKDAKCAGAY